MSPTGKHGALASHNQTVIGHDHYFEWKRGMWFANPRPYSRLTKSEPHQTVWRQLYLPHDDLQGRVLVLTPVSLILGLLTGLFSIMLPLIGIALLYKALHPPVRRVPVRRVGAAGVESTPAEDRNEPREFVAETRVLSWQERRRDPAVWVPMVLGLLLLLLPFGGRRISQYAHPAGSDEPVPLHGEIHDLKRSDGTTIHAEIFGPAGAPTLLLTHGWSTDNTEWFYAKRQLAGQFRIIVWDLPGLGETMPRADDNFSLENMAADLHAVLGLADGKPVVLVGHSIGGMINLTFCKMYPEDLGPRVAGIVEVDSSYTNPIRTTKNSKLNLALQKPVGEPLLHTMIALSPVFRAMNWVSYQEGFQSSSNAKSAFDGTETRGQLDLVSRYSFESSPGVVAKGTLAMFHWDMTPELPQVTVPVLMIVGKDDTTTLPEASEKMVSTIPRGQLQVLPIGRHYTLLESNGAVDSAIAKFASGVLHQD
ncbi:MAG TPA: alpha/beta hydrolase [Acidisarcina sp.]